MLFPLLSPSTNVKEAGWLFKGTSEEIFLVPTQAQLSRFPAPPSLSSPLAQLLAPSLSPSLLYGWTHSLVHCSMRWVSQAGPELRLYVPGIFNQDTENNEINFKVIKRLHKSHNKNLLLEFSNTCTEQFPYSLIAWLRELIPPPTYPQPLSASDVQAWWRGSYPRLLPLLMTIGDSECNTNHMDFGALCSQLVSDPGSGTF